MRLVKVPTNGIPSHWILKQILFPPPVHHFLPRQDAFGNEKEPIISYEDQQDLKKACLMIGLDPTKHFGLQVNEAPSNSQETLAAIKSAANKLNPAEESILKKIERLVWTNNRQEFVESKMLAMNQIIKGYRKARSRKKSLKPVPLPL